MSFNFLPVWFESSLCVSRLIEITTKPIHLYSFIPHFPLPLLNIVTVYCVELKEKFIDFTRHKSLAVYGELTDFFLLSVESI